MGSYRIEVSPNKRAKCAVKSCKDKGIKIQTGEIRLGVWLETERFQSWSWRHWGCITSRVLHNMHESLEEGDKLNFELLDGLADLPADAQARVKKAIETGELDEADKTVRPDEDAGEEGPSSPVKSAEKAKADAKPENKKRRRAGSEEAEETTSKKAKKASGKPAVKKEGHEVKKPAKRGRARKVTEEIVEEPEEPVKTTRRERKKKTETASYEKEVETKQPAKKARGKQAPADDEKPKRSRPKRKAAGDD